MQKLFVPDFDFHHYSFGERAEEDQEMSLVVIAKENFENWGRWVDRRFQKFCHIVILRDPIKYSIFNIWRHRGYIRVRNATLSAMHLEKVKSVGPIFQKVGTKIDIFEISVYGTTMDHYRPHVTFEIFIFF